MPELMWYILVLPFSLICLAVGHVIVEKWYGRKAKQGES